MVIYILSGCKSLLRERCCLAASCLCVEIYAPKVAFGLGFQSLVPPWLGFYEGLDKAEQCLSSDVFSYFWMVR
jgi:hypothetical protein